MATLIGVVLAHIYVTVVVISLLVGMLYLFLRAIMWIERRK